MLNERFPTMRIEIEGARHALLAALGEHHADMLKMVNDAFDRALPVIQAQIDGMVLSALDKAIRNAVDEAAEAASENVAGELAKVIGAQVERAVKQRLTGSRG